MTRTRTFAEGWVLWTRDVPDKAPQLSVALDQGGVVRFEESATYEAFVRHINIGLADMNWTDTCRHAHATRDAATECLAEHLAGSENPGLGWQETVVLRGGG